MRGKMLNQFICLKGYISKKEYDEINKLKEHCTSNDKINLKLGLHHKLNMSKNSDVRLKNINEFLYYVDEVLVAYLCISCFGGNIGEISGMTHPDLRRKGIFKKLFELAIDECKNRNFNKLLLLSDGESNSGIEFIKTVNGSYNFSEYRMKQLNNISSDSRRPINLRKASNQDGKEIQRQNTKFFNDVEASDLGVSECLPEEEEILNDITYMVELKGEIIGKIKVEYSENAAFIYGFGIVPDFRGRGYGKAALKEALRLINEKNINEVELDVECKNNTALNLYKSCGFEEKSVMNYYKYNTKKI